MKSFNPDAGSVSSILKGIVSGPESMLQKLLSAGEFQQATQLMTTVITVLNEDSSQVHERDSANTKNRIEVSKNGYFLFKRRKNSIWSPFAEHIDTKSHLIYVYHPSKH